jgi:hypothetical protein
MEVAVAVDFAIVGYLQASMGGRLQYSTGV